MREIVAAKQPFKREELSRDEALKRFEDQPFKKEIIEGVDEAEGASGQVISVYAQRRLGGPVPRAARRDHRLRSRRSSCSASPAPTGAATSATRCSSGSTAPPGSRRRRSTTTSQRLEEAAKRDHRKLGRELDLFSFPDELGGGLLVWHPKGGALRKALEDFSREHQPIPRLQPVFSPHVARVRAVGDQRPPRSVPGEHVPGDGARGLRLLREADELPVPRPRLQVEDPLVPRSSDPACSSSAPCTGTSAQACCTACCACAVSPRTTRTSSAGATSSSTRSSA